MIDSIVENIEIVVTVLSVALTTIPAGILFIWRQSYKIAKKEQIINNRMEELRGEIQDLRREIQSTDRNIRVQTGRLIQSDRRFINLTIKRLEDIENFLNKETKFTKRQNPIELGEDARDLGFDTSRDVGDDTAWSTFHGNQDNYKT